jgi:hypothetical protein
MKERPYLQVFAIYVYVLNVLFTYMHASMYAFAIFSARVKNHSTISILLISILHA